MFVGIVDLARETLDPEAKCRCNPQVRCAAPAEAAVRRGEGRTHESGTDRAEVYRSRPVRGVRLACAEADSRAQRRYKRETREKFSV